MFYQQHTGNLFTTDRNDLFVWPTHDSWCYSLWNQPVHRWVSFSSLSISPNHYTKALPALPTARFRHPWPNTLGLHLRMRTDLQVNFPPFVCMEFASSPYSPTDHDLNTVIKMFLAAFDNPRPLGIENCPRNQRIVPVCRTIFTLWFLNVLKSRLCTRTVKHCSLVVGPNSIPDARFASVIARFLYVGRAITQTVERRTDYLGRWLSMKSLMNLRFGTRKTWSGNLLFSAYTPATPHD